MGALKLGPVLEVFGALAKKAVVGKLVRAKARIVKRGTDEKWLTAVGEKQTIRRLLYWQVKAVLSMISLGVDPFVDAVRDSYDDKVVEMVGGQKDGTTLDQYYDLSSQALVSIVW